MVTGEGSNLIVGVPSFTVYPFSIVPLVERVPNTGLVVYNVARFTDEELEEMRLFQNYTGRHVSIGVLALFVPLLAAIGLGAVLSIGMTAMGFVFFALLAFFLLLLSRSRRYENRLENRVYKHFYPRFDNQMIIADDLALSEFINHLNNQDENLYSEFDEDDVLLIINDGIKIAFKDGEYRNRITEAIKGLIATERDYLYSDPERLIAVSWLDMLYEACHEAIEAVLEDQVYESTEER